MCVKKNVWVPSTCVCEIDRYLKNITDDLVITCDEIIDVVAISYCEPTKTTPVNFKEKKATCIMENFYILHGSIWISISLLIIVSMYCFYYQMRHQSKQLLTVIN